MTLLRSLLFNFLFMGWCFLAAFLLVPYFFGPPHVAQKVGPIWAKGSLWLARVVAGMRYEIRGQENIAAGPAIYASKHQSAWDTIIFHILFGRAAFVLKKELLRIPFWGWYLWRMRMIAIDRAAGASSVKHLLKQTKQALEDGRPVIIFPEGTRTRPGSASTYHPGITALYSMLKVPVVPVALNSGHFWGRNAYTKRPGTLVLQFLPAIPPGLPKDQFQPLLQQRIEAASQALAQEADAQLSHPH